MQAIGIKLPQQKSN